jgi:hypothetical protein
VPESGDFRINCEARVKADLQEQYDRMYNEKLVDAMRDPWDRLHKMLIKISETLTDSPDGKRSVFRDSLVTNAVTLCELLTVLNVTKDPELEKARRLLEQAITSIDADDLRKMPEARLELKTSVDDILNKFNF